MDRSEELHQLRGEVDALRIILGALLANLVNKAEMAGILTVLEDDLRKKNAPTGAIEVFRQYRELLTPARQ